MPRHTENLHQKHGSEVIKKFATLAESVDSHKPSKKDVRALQQMLDDHPDLWRIAGDLVSHTADQIIDHHTSSLVAQMSLEYNWKELCRDLGYAAASPLEKMLIEHVLLCWFYFNSTQCAFINNLNNQSFMNHKTILIWEKRVTTAQQRYLRASESLARIRKLTRRTPALQVNIATNGGQQINEVNGVTEPLPHTNGTGH